MSEKSLKNTSVVVLPNVRSVHNVGSIFRTSDAAGVDKIYLVGVTPDPVDRFGRERTDIAKVALGAEQNIDWEHVDSLSELVQDLREQNFYIVAVEQSDDSIDYKTVQIPDGKNVAFIFGEETQGLSNDELALADVVAEISMAGDKESLNVSVAAGVALFRILEN